MFLHKVPFLLGQIWENTCSLYQVFGYRGVILFPWLARVYDRDMPSKPPNTRSACFFTHTILHRLVVSVQSFHDMWKFQGKTFGHRQSQFLLLPQVFLKSRVAPFYQLNKSNYSAAWLLGEWGRRWRDELTHTIRCGGLHIKIVTKVEKFDAFLTFSGIDRWSWLSLHYPQVHMYNAKHLSQIMKYWETMMKHWLFPFYVQALILHF